MQLLFKALGLMVIFLTCALTGFSASAVLKKRGEKLSSISRSVFKLAEYINADGGEIAILTQLCFDKKDVEMVNGIPKLNKSFLKKEEIDLIEEFLNDFGSKDKEGEYKRTRLYAKLIDKQCQTVTEKSLELFKLYNTLGVLFGIGICIFFI